MRETDINPILKCDYPDPDVIRVGDTYYMASTTMHFLPGGALLKSYDLIHWELASYIYDSLDETPEENLELEKNNYGAGMWAPTLRFHDGKFYCIFVSNKVHKTFLFIAEDIYGPWEKREISGFYHDCSLLFDDDGRVFLVHGNTTIHLTELDENLTGPKPGGIDKVIIQDDRENVILGYEGSHFYKINGKYYITFIHWPKNPGMRAEAVFTCDTVDGEYKGKDVLCDDRGYFHMGVAQGGIVDTPNGKWYAILFQDSGAVGRIPVLMPVHWEEDFPVFGVNGKIPEQIDVASSRPYYRYEPLYTSDSFNYDVSKTQNPKLKLQWQWNHAPQKDLWKILPGGGLRLKTGKLCINLSQAQNTLTQRMMFPKCEAEVTVDASEIKEGDVAGICALQGLYGLLGVTKIAGNYYLLKIERLEEKNGGMGMGRTDYMPGTVTEKIRIPGPVVTLCLKASFEDMQDKLDFFYLKDGRFAKVGAAHNLKFQLDHFCGARFGLFIYSTKEAGGSAVFKNFEYRYNS